MGMKWRSLHEGAIISSTAYLLLVSAPVIWKAVHLQATRIFDLFSTVLYGGSSGGDNGALSGGTPKF